MATISELVNEYNTVADALDLPNVKHFTDKEYAEKRVAEIYAKLNDATVAEMPNVAIMQPSTPDPVEVAEATETESVGEPEAVVNILPVRKAAKNADASTIAARAAKWGFGCNVTAYLESVRLQGLSRKMKSANDPNWAIVHAEFREINRNKKEKYAVTE